MLKTDWLRFYDVLPKNDPSNPDPEKRFPVRRIVVAVDTKKKESQRGDFSAIATGVLTKTGDVYIAEVKRGRWLYPDLEKEIDNTAHAWGPSALLVEPEGMGLQYINTRRTNAPAPLLEAQHRKKDKEFRFDATMPYWMAGRVHLPKQASWVGEFMKELLEFPNSQYDDQVDAVTYLLSHLFTTSGSQNLGTARLKAR